LPPARLNKPIKKMFMKKILPLFLLIIFFIPLAAQAVSLVPACAQGQAKGADFCCALTTISNFIHLILGLMGSIALLLFIYAGFEWITSAGASEKIKKSQTLMGQTIVGRIIIISAWAIINFVITSFAGSPKITGADKNWYQLCSGGYTARCTALGAGWDCRSLSECNLKNWSDCSGPNCKQGLCPGKKNSPDTFVCCKME